MNGTGWNSTHRVFFGEYTARPWIASGMLFLLVESGELFD